MAKHGSRLLEVDSLRGLAALAVVLFHYTTQYDRLFGHVGKPLFTVPWGHFGVQLFFMISGFVIFMTLERTQRPADFVVSRFSRLYPAYWAAVLLSFAITTWSDLPDKVVDLQTAAANLLMFQGWFGVKPVDGVYWTLQVELIYYIIALALHRLGMLKHVHAILLAWLGLRWLYWLFASFLGIDLPYIAYRFLIVGFIPYFAVGMMVYRATQSEHADPRDWVVVACAMATLFVVESLETSIAAVVALALLLAATRWRVALLRSSVLVWLGAISYSLYLIHENIGWALIRALQAHGLAVDASIGVAIAMALALASALTWTIEKPAMRFIRARYAAHRSSKAASRRIPA